MTDAVTALPPVTILIEWENAIAVEDQWTKRTMAALERELERVQGRMPQKPRVMYLFDETAVQAATIERVIGEIAPRLREFADVELVPTPGLSYYKLKNFGVARTATDIVVMLDSDAGPEPGWLDGLMRPFADPEMMAVGGFTVLGHDGLVSKAMALSWLFNLPSEGARTARRMKIHPNNCAFRTAFFKANPFPDLPTFKKQCGFWLRDIDARGFKWVRTADAMTVHAPHPGFRFIAWRGWTAGRDRDFETFHTATGSRVGRLGHASKFFGKKLARAWKRILLKGGEVELPIWQRPLAMGVAFGYFASVLAGQATSALTRSFGPLPATGAPRALVRAEA